MLAPLDDLVACGHRIVRIEGRVAHQHLKHDRADGPPVALHAVPTLQQHFRRNVVGRPCTPPLHVMTTPFLPAPYPECMRRHP
eukprot:scaffold3352_cov326-Prasinococcus_capsulatus_cf.AAC.11